MCIYINFFFQAEDGIRDTSVTGVQTCALPICRLRRRRCQGGAGDPPLRRLERAQPEPLLAAAVQRGRLRSEERRVGKGVEIGIGRMRKKKQRSSEQRNSVNDKYRQQNEMQGM